jgi:hypothetical protein
MTACNTFGTPTASGRMSAEEKTRPLSMSQAEPRCNSKGKSGSLLRKR